MSRRFSRIRVWPLGLAVFALMANALGAGTRPAGVPAGSRRVGPIAGGWILPSGRLLQPWGDQIELPGGQSILVVVNGQDELAELEVRRKLPKV